MNHNEIKLGIDAVSHHLQPLEPGRAYLLTGERGTAKTTFVLQFLYQGLQERRRCVLVTDEAKAVLKHAEFIGIDLSRFMKDGSLVVYEIAGQHSFSLAELSDEIKEIVESTPGVRLALEGLAQSPAANGKASISAGAVADFFRRLEGLKATSLITWELPAPDSAAPLQKALEEAAAGCFLLKPTSDERTKAFAVKKPASAARGDIQIRIEPGHGIVEPIKRSRVRFPRPDEH